MSINSIDTVLNGYEVVIGIEVHVQLNTKSKIFCADSTNFSAGDNENISPISLGMPGTLPTLNKAVLDLAIKTGLALNCHIRPTSFFARKNYFYPDLPKGYQISQFEEPICENGFVEFVVQGQTRKVSITRAHLEEDAGKSTHFPDHTLLNYNRAGIPLLEIVSGPEMKSAQEASAYCKAIRSIVQYLEVCDGNLEEGSLRCDCNVSVKKIGQVELGTKVELKNLNSFRFIEKALDFEIERQVDLCLSNKAIIQETRLYDPDKNRTYSMRSKENAQDYRYFRDPDLLPIVVSSEKIQAIQKTIPELPQKKIIRFINELGLSSTEAETLTSDKNLANFFEATMKVSGLGKQSANWILGEVLRYSNENHQSVSQIKVTPTALAELIHLVEKKVVSVKIAKSVLNEMMNSGQSAKSIVEQQGFKQVTDLGDLEKMAESVLIQNPSQVAEYRAGKEKVFGFFVGAMMKLTQGQADPETINKLLKEKLSGSHI